MAHASIVEVPLQPPRRSGTPQHFGDRLVMSRDLVRSVEIYTTTAAKRLAQQQLDQGWRIYFPNPALHLVLGWQFYSGGGIYFHGRTMRLASSGKA